MCTACFHIYRAMYVLVLTKYHSLCCLNADVTVVVAANGRCHSAGEMDRTGSCSAGQHSSSPRIPHFRLSVRHQSCCSCHRTDIYRCPFAVRCVCGVSAVCLQRQETNKYQQLNCYITSNSIKAGKTVLIKIEVIRSVE